MAWKITAELERELKDSIQQSLRKGKAARWTNVVRCALVLVGVLAVLVMFGVPHVIVVAVMVAVANLCVVWALLNVSASLHTQLDSLTTMISYYVERERADE